MPASLSTSLSSFEKEQIIKDYQNNISIREISIKYGYSRPALSKFLEEVGAKTTKGNHYRKYFHDTNFFEKIDTEEKAYWLGFMFADGYIIDNSNRYGEDGFGLSLAEDSLDSLLDFKRSIRASNPINKDLSGNKKNPNKQVMYKIEMRSQKTVNDLIDKGCFKNKTAILEPPIGVPDNLIHHFIRGFYDGDGSIIKSNKKNSSYIFYGVNFTSTKDIVEWISSFFSFGTIVKEDRREFIWYFKTNSNQQSIKLLNFLYKDATIYMKRKHDRYLELLSKYGESQGRNG